MPSYGPACRGCSAEDCPCCETFVEWKADQRASLESDPAELEADMRGDEFPDDDEEGVDYDEGCAPEVPEDNMTDVEADANTLASAGYGTDEDYGGVEDMDMGYYEE